MTEVTDFGLKPINLDELRASAAEDRLVEAKSCSCPNVIKKLSSFPFKIITALGSYLQSMTYDRKVAEYKKKDAEILSDESRFASLA
ncbi:MAG: hypothetical protein K1060chlam1_00788 [Candidatus Anoxychlamydiales bacterium]|nr:hypothetical protein [Candidatus Anoxychlamydiales bacterium]